MADSEYQRGDEVRLPSKADYRQPMTVDVVYHTGELRLSDRFNAPIVGVHPEAVVDQ